MWVVLPHGMGVLGELKKTQDDHQHFFLLIDWVQCVQVPHILAVIPRDMLSIPVPVPATMDCAFNL